MCFALIAQDSIKRFECCWNSVDGTRFRSYPSTIIKEDKEQGFTAHLKEARPMSPPQERDLERLRREIRNTGAEGYLERVRIEQGTTGKPELRTPWLKDKVRFKKNVQSALTLVSPLTAFVFESLMTEQS